MRLTKMDFLPGLWLLLYSPQVPGSYFSIKWNSGTFHQGYCQQLPDAEADTDSERGGSPGFERYPHAFPVICFLSKLHLFWFFHQYFRYNTTDFGSDGEGIKAFETLGNFWQLELNSSTSKHWLSPTTAYPEPGHLAHTLLRDCKD